MPGKWKGVKRCGEGMAICSMDLKIEEFQGDWPHQNDAGMSGGRFRCCIVPETAVLIFQGNLKHTRHGYIYIYIYKKYKKYINKTILIINFS